MWQSRRFGAHQASRWLTACQGRLYKQDGTQRGIIHSSGFGADDLAFVGTSFVQEVKHYTDDRSFPVASYASNERWGNDAAQTEIGALRTYAQASLGWKSGKVFLIGGSMGALASLNYMRNNAANVQAVALIVPAVNLEDLHDAHAGTYTASINTAYTNEAGYLAALDTHSPWHDPAAYDVDVPILALISDNDTLAVTEYAHDFIDAIPSAERLSLGNVAHTSTDTTALSIKNEIADFFQANT